MTIEQILKKYRTIEIELLLLHALGKPKEFLYIHPETKLTILQYKKVLQYVKRRQKGEPMAYILGYKDFYGLRFKVNNHVLIPRPETEMIVDAVVQALGLLHKPEKQATGPHYNRKIRILDVGTGSGCIAISLAKNLKADLYASDVSKKALSIAKQNASQHHVKIKFIKSDLLKNINGDFDIITANLPYGWHGVKNRFSSVKDGLKFEPQSALYTQEKGLMEIRRLLEQISSREYQPKFVYLEFDPRQKKDLQKLIKKYLPSSNIGFHRDLNNFWRCAEVEIV